MSTTSVALILLLFTLLSLLVVSAINKRETRTRLINQKLAQMKRRALELQELSVALEPLVENNKIPQLINDEAIDVLKAMLKLSPNNNFFALNLENAQQRAADLQNANMRCPINRLMESDAAIARAQYMITEAARIVRKRHAAEFIPAAEMDNLLRELNWANFMVKITANVAQGHRAVNRGDSLRAFAFYRKALEIATEGGGYKDDRQGRLIFEIGEILNNKRMALSPNLMPETQYNPT